MVHWVKLGRDCYENTEEWLLVLPERRTAAGFTNLWGIESLPTTLLAAKL